MTSSNRWRRPYLVPLALVGLIGLVLLPVGSRAQCVVRGTVISSGTPGSPFISVAKTLSGGTGSVNCVLTMGSGAGMTSGIGTNASCFQFGRAGTLPSPPYNCMGAGPSFCRALAGVFTPTVFPTGPHRCYFACNGCGPSPVMISITGADGLPVELMDFQVEEQ